MVLKSKDVSRKRASDCQPNQDFATYISKNSIDIFYRLAIPKNS